MRPCAAARRLKKHEEKTGRRTNRFRHRFPGHFYESRFALIRAAMAFVRLSRTDTIGSTGQTKNEVMRMSHVSPALRPAFEALSIDLKNEILSRGVTLNTLNDLMAVLQNIVDEAAP